MPPGVNGTIQVIGRLGKSSAAAGATTPNAARIMARRAIHFDIGFSFQQGRLGDGGFHTTP
jgi:hypothetical protein